VLKELQKEMSLEAVERLMEQSAEGVAYQKVRLTCLSLSLSSGQH
jgi:hypothetical protein